MASVFRVIIIITALMMEAVNSSEPWVSFYQITQHNIPKDSHLKILISLISFLEI
jgi:hypothetical protein